MNQKIKIRSIEVLNKHNTLVKYEGVSFRIENGYILLDVGVDNRVKVLPLKEIKEYKINIT